MATAVLRSGSGVRSPLAVDLALMQVDFAALQARRGQPLSDEAVPAAKMLGEYYSRQLRAAKSSGPMISESLVPDMSTREFLQKGLASICRSRPALDKQQMQDMGRILELLTTLDKTGNFGSEDAKEIHSLILRLEPKRTTRSSSSRLAKLSRSRHAF